MTIGERFTVDELLEIVRRAAPFETLTREALEGVLGMLVGRLPVRRVRGAQAAGHLGPPDRRGRGPAGRARRRRHQRRHDPGPRPVPGVPRGRGRARPGGASASSTRRWSTSCAPGCTATSWSSGASSWRVAEITPQPGDRDARRPGVPGKLPFWKGDAVGRPIELGRAIGRVRARDARRTSRRGRRAGRRRPSACGATTTSTTSRPRTSSPTSRTSARRRASCPTDRRIVIERFRDELGDWRLVDPDAVRRPGPRPVDAWRSRRGSRSASASRSRRSGPTTASRSGCPRATSSLDGVEALLFPDPEEVEDLVVGRVGQSSLFASRFRENAARALLLPRRRPGTRTPLWQQRQRAADLLAVASRATGASRSSSRRTASASPTSSTCRPCARSSAASGAGRSRVHSVETARASAFASSLLFDYVAAYMYEGDAPLAERRAQALTLDRDLLRELLGQEELRELLDPDALADLELSLQALVEERQAHDPDQVHDLLRRLGRPRDRTRRGRGRSAGASEASLHLAELAASRRAVRARIGGEERWIAMEDVARYRDGVGVRGAAGRAAGVPRRRRPGRSTGCSRGTPGRTARSWAREPARRWGLPRGRGRGRAPPAGRGRDPCSAGEFRPGGAEREYCDPEVLRLLRRRSLAKLRREVEPVDPVTLARFLPAWQGVAAVAVRVGQSPAAAAPRPDGARAPGRGRGPARRPADPGLGPRAGRAPGARPRLPAAAARRAGRDGRGRLGGAGEPRPRRRPRRPATGPGRELLRPTGPPGRRRAARRTRSTSGSAPTSGGAAPRSTGSCSRRRAARSDREVLDALWDLVWAGEVTNDTFAPLRALRWKRPAKDHRPRPGPADGARAAGGRGPLVAGRRRPTDELPDEAPAVTRTERVHALALVAARAPRRRDPRGRRRASRSTAASPRSTRCCARWRRRAGSGAATSSTAWAPPSSRCPGAVDRLRALRDQPGELAGEHGRIVHLLAAADPANPYGAALAWPRRGDADRRPFQRAAGAYVALVDGAAVALPGPRRDVDPGAPRGRRPRRRWRPPSRPCATSSPTAGSASS